MTEDVKRLRIETWKQGEDVGKGIMGQMGKRDKKGETLSFNILSLRVKSQLKGN